MPSRSVLTNVGHAVRSARTNPLPRSSTIASDRSTLSIGTLRGRSGRCLARACWGYRYFVPTGHLAPPPALASQLWGAPLVGCLLPSGSAFRYHAARDVCFAGFASPHGLSTVPTRHAATDAAGWPVLLRRHR